MEDLAQAFGRSRTPFGPMDRWPQFVRTAVGGADVTSREVPELQIHQTLDSLSDAFFAIDIDWRFAFVNPQGERMLGRQTGDLVGKVLWIEYPGVAGTDFEHAYRRAAKERIATSVTVYYADHDRWYEVHALPAYGGGISICFSDVSERHQLAGTLADTRRKLDSALIAGEVGTFEWDVINDRLWGDQNFARIFGIQIDASGAAPLATYVGAIHPADRDIVMERITQAVETGCDYEAEYRITNTVPPRWVTARGKVERDESGRAVRFPGVVLDETRRKQAELLLADQNRVLQLVASGAPVSRALETLARAVEDLYDGDAVAAILLLDEDGRSLRTGAAPGLPAEYNAAMDGIHAEPGVGTCADAAARNEVVVTPDIAASPAWRGLSHLPLALGLKAAWSMPIRASDGRVLGTFGTYFRECREPSTRERQIVESLCVAAALAIEQRHAGEALRDSEQRRRLALDAAELGAWHVNPVTMRLTTDARFRAMFGVTEDRLDYERAMGLIHPDDRDRVRDAVAAATKPQEPAPYAIEYRVVHPDRSVRWVFAKGRASFVGIGLERRIASFDGTLADITERKLADAERQALLDGERSARAEADAANRAKDAFLAVLSHELRTPLSPVVMTVAELEQRADLPYDVRASMAMIRRNIDLETRMIDDLLDVSRVISGKLRLRIEPTSLHEILRHAFEVAASDVNAKQLTVKFDFGATNDRVMGDASRLQQVFWNLLKNAIKFTPERGEVTLRTVDVGPGRVRVEVADTGVGIARQALSRIFDAFDQGDTRTSHKFGGLGLGLAISHAVVDMHGGTIIASSDGVGSGATFTVELGTVLAAPVARAPNADVVKRLLDEREACRLLLVEDHPDTAKVMGRLLGRSGYLVTVAHSAASALKFAAAGPFDLVISDIGLPDASGYDLMRELKSQYGLRGIALSGYGMDSDVRLAQDAGFEDHVTKPVNLSQLEAAIERVRDERDSQRSACPTSSPRESDNRFQTPRDDSPPRP